MLAPGMESEGKTGKSDCRAVGMDSMGAKFAPGSQDPLLNSLCGAFLRCCHHDASTFTISVLESSPSSGMIRLPPHAPV